MNMNVNTDLLQNSNIYNFSKNTMFNNTGVLITISIVIIFYYVIFSSLGISTNMMTGKSSGIMSANLSSNISNKSSNNNIMSLIEILLWGLFIFLIIINSLQYVFNLDINTVIKNIFSPMPEIDVTITKEQDHETTVPEIMYEKQVFHIPDNKYTYDDARALCKAYGSELATYEQIETAYNNGGEWCGYGWSENQLALFPTQQATYDKLQNKKGHENDCGRPGINGGFIANPNVKFGVNCYGYKPEITPLERQYMSEVSPYPITKKDREFEKKVNKYKDKLSDIMVSPFNNNKWSVI
jgi:hypothetical protein